jgi:hypothetical protein
MASRWLEMRSHQPNDKLSLVIFVFEKEKKAESIEID